MTLNLPADADSPPPAGPQTGPARAGRAPRPPLTGPRPQAASRIRATQSSRRPAARPGRRAPDARVPQLPVRISSPAALLAVIPGLLGFVPGASIVVIGTESP